MKHLKLFFACLLMAVLSIGQVCAAEGNVVYKLNTGSTTITNSSSYDALTTAASCATDGTASISTAKWKFTCGSKQTNSPAGFWLGSNSNQKAKMKLSQGSIAEGTAIATAISVSNTDTYYAALISETALPNVGKVTLTYNSTGGTAPSEAWICYSTDEGASWSVAKKVTSLSSSGTDFTFDATIASARYAFVIHSTGYCQFKVPVLTFYEGATGGTTNPTVSADPAAISDVSAAGVTNQTISLSYEDFVGEYIAGVSLHDDAAGEENFSGDWLSASVSETDAYATLTYTVSANTGATRTAYIKVSVLDEGSNEKSIIIPVSQVAPSYTIAAQSNNTSYGTVSLSGNVITGSPVTGYTYADPAYTVNPANSATVSQNGNAFTVTPSANTTVTINFEALPTYTVTLKDNNATLTQASYGAKVTLPSRTGCDDTPFAGWSTTNNADWTAAAPTIIPAVDYIPTANVDLYPVYTMEESGSGAAVGTTLWAEEFSGFEGGDVPSSNKPGNPTVYGGGSVTYSVTNGGGTTKIYNESLAGGASPEILVAKSNGTFVISGIPTGGAATATLSYHTNKTPSVSSSTEGVTVSNPVSADANDDKLYSRTITFGAGVPATFALTFTASENTRVDDISLVVASAGTTTMYRSTPDCCTKYTISIADGITNGTVSADKAKACETAEVALTATPATGYELSVWDVKKANNDAVTVSNNKFEMPASNVTVSATFAPQVHQIIYHKNDGAQQETTSSVNFYYGVEFTSAAATLFSREGYNFAGWNTKADGKGTAYNAATAYTLNEVKDVDLYAQWVVNTSRAISYSGDAKLTYNPAKPIATDKDANISLAFEVSEAGWYIAGVTVMVGENELTEGVTLTQTSLSVTAPQGGFADAISIAFNVQEIVYTVTCGTTELTQEHYGDNVTLPAGPALSEACVADGWSFAGWAEAAIETETDEAPENLYNGEYEPTATIELFPVYKRTEGTVFDGKTGGDFYIYAQVGDNKYYAKGTGDKMASATNRAEATLYTFATYDGGFSIKTGDNYITYSSGTNLGTATNAYKWTFAQGTKGTWRANSATSGRAIVFRAGTTLQFGGYATSNITANGTEYYDVEIAGATTDYYLSNPVCYEKYTITIAEGIQNGTISANVAKAAEGDKVTLTATPAQHYHLDAWTVSKAEGTVSVENNQFTMPGEAVTVSATFAIDHHNVVFNKNAGDETEPTQQDFYYGQTQKLTANSFDNEGYNFAGWMTDANGDVADYTDEDSYTLNADADVNLYALWVSNTIHTIAYSGDTYIASYTENKKPATVDQDDANIAVEFTLTTGYQVTGVTVTMGDDELTSGVEFTQGSVTITKPEGGFTDNISIAFTISEIVYTVTLDKAENQTQASYGVAVTLPEAALSELCAADGWSFAGWAEAAITEQETTTAPTLYKGEYTPTADINLYAVYKRSEESGEKVTKYIKTALADVANEDEVVITEGDAYALPNTGTTSSAPAATSITVANDEIATPNSGLLWIVSKNGDKLSFTAKGSTNQLYCTDNNNGVRVGTSTNNEFTITDGYLYNTANTRYVGVYNTTDWRCYKLTNNEIASNIAGQTFAFYKKAEVGTMTVYYFSEPVCCQKYDVNLGDIQNGKVTRSLEKACENAEVTLTATPNDGYEFSAWSITGVSLTEEQAATNPLTITMLASAITVSASFTEAEVVHNVVYAEVEHITYTAQPTSVADAAQNLTVTYSIDDQYRVTGVTVTMGEETVDASKITLTQTSLTVAPEGGITADVNIAFTIDVIKYKVTFNAGTGTCAKESETQASFGAAINLPEVTPSTYCAADGWVFAGWKVGAAVAETTNAQELVTGATYTPEADVTLYAVYSKTEEGESETHYEVTTLDALTGSDVFVIIGNNGSNYAMSNDKGTGNAPTATPITIENNQITEEVADALKWNISGNATDGYTFYPNGSTTTWLYCTNANNGVRVGTNDAKVFVVDGGYLKHSGTNRYVGVYNSQDWRCYTSSSTNINNQTFAFYKKTEVGTMTTYYFSNPSCAAKYAITVDSEIANGSVSVSGANDLTKVAAETALTLTATATENAGRFNKWVIEGITLTAEQEVANPLNIAMPENAISVSALFDALYAITKDEQHGTLTLSAAYAAEGDAVTISAVAATDYKDPVLKVFKTGDESTEVAINDGAFTMPDYAVTAQVICTSALPEATLKLSENGSVSTFAGAYHQNDVVTLPTTSSQACEGKELVGWSSVAVEETDTKPTDNYWAKGASYTMSAGEQTLYAVYATVTSVEYEETELADIAASDIVVITGNNGSVYAMSNDKAASAAPTAVAVPVEDNKLKGDVAANILWNITKDGNNLTIYPNGSTTTWLYCIDNNNGVRVGTGSDKVWTITDEYLYNSGRTRYVGVYNNADFRSYTTINNNIKDQTLAFYKQVASATGYVTSCTAAPTVTVEEEVTVAAAGESEGVITVTYDHVNLANVTAALFNDATCTDAFTGGWMTAEIAGDDKHIAYTAVANETYAARTAYIQLTAPGSSSSTSDVKVIEVTQEAKAFANLAELVEANIATGTIVTVSFDEVITADQFINNGAKRAGIMLTTIAGTNAIEIFYNKGTTAVPAEWLIGGSVSAEAKKFTWTDFNGQWELVPLGTEWTWDNGDLVYTAPKTVSSVVITGDPSKTSYVDGEKFNPAGLTVTVNYNDETSEVNPIGVTFECTPARVAKSNDPVSVSVVATFNTVASDPFVVEGLTVGDIQKKTIAEFIAAGNEDARCYLEGTVSDYTNTNKGYFNLTDASGTIYIYGCDQPSEFEEGDKIKVIAEDYDYYNSKHEAKNVEFVEILPQAVTGVTIDEESKTIGVGQSFNLTATVQPINASNKSVTWSSDKPGIAKVEEGVVTGMSAGEAVITVTTEDEGFTATCTVTVQAAFSVTYNTAGSVGTTPVDEQTYLPGEEVTLKSASLTNAGFFFNGWNATYIEDEVIKVLEIEDGKITMPAANVTVTAQWAPKSTDKWIKVNATSELEADEEYIIVNEDATYAIGEQKTNNRSAAAIDENDGVVNISTAVKLFTLGIPEADKYTFMNNGKYLYASHNTKNYLNEQATNDANGVWTITIEEGVATITATGANSHNVMRFNPNNGNPLFACYTLNSTTGTLVAIYKKAPVERIEDGESVDIATIDEYADVIVEDGGVLTVTDNKQLGDLTVENGGSVVVSGDKKLEADNVVVENGGKLDLSATDAKVEAKNLYLSATMAGGTSSQMDGAEEEKIVLATDGDVFFDVTLGANGRADQWHAFTVPFQVDVMTGVYDLDGNQLVNEVNYAIMDYHGDLRAQGQYGWKKIRTTLQPGVFYLMTVDGQRTTYRFKKKEGAAIVADNSIALQEYAISGTGEQGKDNGWNGVGNPTLNYGTVNHVVQVLDPISYTYKTALANDTNFVVGTPFFVQAGENPSPIVMGDIDPNKPFYAPARTQDNKIENLRVSFGNADFTDKLYISANTEALNSYETGKDLLKMTMSNTPKVAQIFGDAYGMKLTMVNIPMANNKAEVAMTLYAPAAGEYTISVPAIEGYNVYLTQNGNIIWNLSMSAYTAEFAKGNTAGYGIRIVKAPQVTTDVDNLYENASGVQKVIIDEHVFILRGEKMYDVNGQMVK